MPLSMQVKLLRALQDGEIEPIGSTKSISVDVRIIAATNRPLENMIEEKRFREDLFYRINVVPFSVPPLRERAEDLTLLIAYFIGKVTNRLGKRIAGIEKNVMEILQSYSWPGNIRELENVIEAAVHLTKGEQVTLDSLPDYLQTQTAMYRFNNKKLKDIMEETEKWVLMQSLERNKDDKVLVGRELGISRSTLYEKLNKYGLL
ncbi:transcriptional regulator BkdR of isoleucine and valine catabolism operon [Mesobacillus boroniphilus JCM 21738]|uniref:Transcriptional regulator BkdR of isoleucine and valine catabolism operon n=1 Tax=Mesobacillus boroniphilus JCM 21738 TaxID=1294265 RepID=W4RNK8_9BACI|nr:transcriptional regulator BkdR of isoleucine and valine catabolism operon [Mesobacillus boroniphilus JCM 21738]